MLTVVCTRTHPTYQRDRQALGLGIREQQDTMPSGWPIRTPTIDESRVLAPALVHASACNIHVSYICMILYLQACVYCYRSATVETSVS